ncbi:TIGR00282 family metallophosphoesterase [Neomegalonema sp.]|uniref:TIGR00282 family metallophosphoesterase n=1 Tax=Neomegalonema sp. TaxID=2039713 RepID=UPI0026349373|nr:TIGR00282 family metallophosphoesterase [Neomegalonema sp.]MDD2869442.1 TIGR00282 family metallophosphoesterase [Neomegalonema sp.]
MRILFLGDLLGRSGREAAVRDLPGLRSDLRLDCVVVNAENAAAGFGVTSKIAEAVFEAGADAITLGNHAFDNREILPYLDRDPRIVRPVNLPKGTPGRGSALVDLRDGRRILVVNALGRVFMNPCDDPFAAIDAQLTACPLGVGCDAALIDFHAEATSEKMAMGHWCDGRASLVVGTHTHVPSGDAQVLAGGTAYQTDAGMCGDYDSVIGMIKDEPLRRFTTGQPLNRYEPKIGEATLCGVFVETDDATGLATRIAPLRRGGRLSAAWPDPQSGGA